MNLTTLNVTQELLRIIAELDKFNATWEIHSSHNPPLSGCAGTGG